MTNDLAHRISEHRAGGIPGFTSDYRCRKLIHYEHLRRCARRHRTRKATQDMVASKESGIHRNSQPTLEGTGAGDPRRIVRDVSASLDVTGAELQKENAPAAQPPERLKITFPNLADLGAQKPAVIFHSYLTAAEQVGDGGNGFAAAFGAGTNGEN